MLRGTDAGVPTWVVQVRSHRRTTWPALVRSLHFPSQLDCSCSLPVCVALLPFKATISTVRTLDFSSQNHSSGQGTEDEVCPDIFARHLVDGLRKNGALVSSVFLRVLLFLFLGLATVPLLSCVFTSWL